MESESIARRQHASAEERSRLVRLYRASGLTQTQFARQQGIKLCTLRQWLYRSGSRTGTKVPARFQELPASSLFATAWWAEISLDAGTTLRLSGAASPNWISSVISALRQKPC